MENSVNNSCMMNRTSSIDNIDEDQESGWTSYFEEFMSYQRRNDSANDSFFTSSMVSDAASLPAWNRLNNNYNHLAASQPKFPKKLTFKKTRAKEISYDDSLEDTASSPVNSPKVSDFGMADMNPRRANNHFNSSLGKGGSLQHYGEVIETNNYSDLKKRGLCLVPFSMLVNYLV